MYTSIELKKFTTEAIISKLKEIPAPYNYSIATDAEFYYLAGLVYNKLKFKADRSIFKSSIFVNIENILRKDYTVEKIKKMIKEAYKIVLKKIDLDKNIEDNKLGQLMAALLSWQEESTTIQETRKDLFIKGLCDNKYLKLEETEGVKS